MDDTKNKSLWCMNSCDRIRIFSNEEQHLLSSYKAMIWVFQDNCLCSFLSCGFLLCIVDLFHSWNARLNWLKPHEQMNIIESCSEIFAENGLISFFRAIVKVTQPWLLCTCEAEALVLYLSCGITWKDFCSLLGKYCLFLILVKA